MDTEIDSIYKNQIQPLTVISLDTLLYFPSNEVKEIDKLLSGYSNHLYPIQFIGSKPITEKEATIKYQESMNPFDLVLASRTRTDWNKLILETISSLNSPKL